VYLPLDASDRKPVGRTRETVSAIGLGTWAIRDPRAMEEALVYAFTHGIDNVDTAEMYGNGLAEEVVGRAVARVGRDNVFITTKLLPHRFRSPDAAEKAMRRSLERLRVNYVDLILIHWPDDLVPVEHQIAVLEGLVEKGYARYMGVSGFDKDLLERALGVTRKHEIVADQVKYSVLDRRIERSLLPFCVERGVTVQAYTPIERGRVADVEVLRTIAMKYGKTPVQVALNFLISRPRVVAIPKSERVERVKEFIGAMGWRLSPEDVALIESSLPG